MIETFNAGPGLGRLSDATIVHGDCIEAMRQMPAESVDAIVTDPPYGLGFMGKAWDALPPGEEWAKQCLRVLKPGGHLLAFGGTRTWHRLAVAIEDGGFEIRDSIAWLYGSGFPKSLDVSKAIDKAAGATREVVGQKGGRYASGFSREASGAFAPGDNYRWGDKHYAWDDLPVEARDYLTEARTTIGSITAPATPEAEQWQGWGTAMKPAFEPVVVGRKPIVGTVAANVLAHGTGALNIDRCRVASAEDDDARRVRVGGFSNSPIYGRGDTARFGGATGRWPANVILDEDQAAELDQQSGDRPGFASQNDHQSRDKFSGTDYGTGLGLEAGRREGYNDSGGASRFFYCAKAPKRERPVVDGAAHPTVKPLALMRWLVRLVTPPGGLVLDPFAGSGTTLEAALLEGFRVTVIENDTEHRYLEMIQQRLARVVS